MTSQAYDTIPVSTANGTVVVNSFQSNVAQDLVFHGQRAVADVATISGGLALGFALGNVPGMLIAGGAMATAAMFSRIGRTHDVRERPLIENTTHIARIGERIVYKLGEKPAQPHVWLAVEDELCRHATGTLHSAFFHRVGQSLPVKAVYTYPRLALAKARDFLTSMGSYIYNGPAGVSCHEGVASRRLERAGLITPNPRTQQHIHFARDWYKQCTGHDLG